MHRKFNFIIFSKKLIQQQLPQYMRYIGKPEVLADTFLPQAAKDSKRGAALTDKDIQSLLPTRLVLEPGETRLGLFAIRLDQLNLSEYKKMRKVFPAHEYQSVRNSKRARNYRMNKQNSLQELIALNQDLKAKNRKLRQLLVQRLQNNYDENKLNMFISSGIEKNESDFDDELTD